MYKFYTLILSLTIFINFSTEAQYCTPSVSTGGLYFSYVSFDYAPSAQGITGGQVYLTASNGYTVTGGSAGTIKRNCTGSLWFGVQNQTGSTQNVYIKVFCDFNGDFDFTDPGEEAGSSVYNNLATGSSLGTGLSINMPPVLDLSNLRVRITVKAGSYATACGTFTGEVEDYTLTIPANTAPTINNSAIPILNRISETETASEGMLIGQVIYSLEPTTAIVSDADACDQYLGIAITGTSATNGIWEYKIPSGSWTSIGAVSESNALLLFSKNDTETRIRFVPTGAGTPSLTFRTWDRSVSTNGSYHNITATGGSTAFSTGTVTATMDVVSASSIGTDINFYAPSYGNEFNRFNLIKGKLNRSSAVFTNVKEITTDNLAGAGYDIVVDATSNKLFWIAGDSYASLMSSNLDGTAVTNLTNFVYPTGLALGNNKLYILDYGTGIFSTNLDGTGGVNITGGAGQVNDLNETGDIEFFNNKLYYVNQPGAYGTAFYIRSTNIDGTATTDLYSTLNRIYGLAVGSTAVYFTEMNGSVSYLKSIPLTGGAATTIATMSNRYWNDLYLDEPNAKLYISDAPVASNRYGFIRSISTSGGALTTNFVSESSLYGIALETPTATLPVSITSVNASAIDTKNKVNWKTTNEYQVKHYEVQRSADGVIFSVAGIVTATGTQEYQWIDVQPFTGKSFYRIKAVDFNGTTSQTNVVVIYRSGTAAIHVFPTLLNAGQSATLQYSAVNKGLYKIRLLSATGIEMQVYSVNISGTGSITLPVPANLPKGFYLLQLNGKDMQYQTKIIVQ